jgi:hypothetical protein
MPDLDAPFPVRGAAERMMEKPAMIDLKTGRKKQGQYSESSRVSFAATTTWFSGWFSARVAGALVDGGTTRDGDAAKRTANRQGGAGEGGVLAVRPERHQQAQQGQRALSNCALRFVSPLAQGECVVHTWAGAVGDGGARRDDRSQCDSGRAWCQWHS